MTTSVQLSLGLCRAMPWRPMGNPPRRGRLYQDDEWDRYIVDDARGRTIKLRLLLDRDVEELCWTREQWRQAGLRDIGSERRLGDPCNL